VGFVLLIWRSRVELVGLLMRQVRVEKEVVGLEVYVV